MPTLVECKLWRNPEARREVVGQILDYARALRRWTYAELQREVARARKQQGFDLVAHMRAHGHPDLDQAAFVDNVTRNLAKGRMLLLVLGDGIREGVEAIGSYLQEETGLHFTFGLVEAQVFDLDEGRRILQPRVLARTVNVVRNVFNVGPYGAMVEEALELEPENDQKAPLNERGKWLLGFWTELLKTMKLDDTNQKPANATSYASIYFSTSKPMHFWFRVNLSPASNHASVSLSYAKTEPLAVEIISRFEAQRDEINDDFAKVGIEIEWDRQDDGKLRIIAKKKFPAIQDIQYRAEELAWFSRTINAFVNILSPRIEGHWSELTGGSQG